MKRYISSATVALAAVVLGACSSGYSASDLQKDLESKGDMSPETAKCVASAVEDKGIDISAFGSAKTLEEAVLQGDQEAFARVLVDCAMKEAGLGDITIPDLDTPDLSEDSVPE